MGHGRRPAAFNGGLVYDLATGNQTPCPERPRELWASQAFDYGTREKILGYRGRRILATKNEVYGRREGDCLALAGKALIEGGPGSLKAFDTQSKHEQEVIWKPNWRAAFWGWLSPAARSTPRPPRHDPLFRPRQSK